MVDLINQSSLSRWWRDKNNINKSYDWLIILTSCFHWWRHKNKKSFDWLIWLTSCSHWWRHKNNTISTHKQHWNIPLCWFVHLNHTIFKLITDIKKTQKLLFLIIRYTYILFFFTLRKSAAQTKFLLWAIVFGSYCSDYIIFIYFFYVKCWIIGDLLFRVRICVLSPTWVEK